AAPGEQLGAVVKDAWASLDQPASAGKQGSRPISGIHTIRDGGSGSPYFRMGIVSGSVSVLSWSAICAHVEDGPVRSQNARAKFVRCVICVGIRIPKLHGRVSRACPLAG